jgi:hypothetical protein
MKTDRQGMHERSATPRGDRAPLSRNPDLRGLRSYRTRRSGVLVTSG